MSDNNLAANTMSKAESQVNKPETMKSYVWIRTADGSIQEVEQEVAILCPTIDVEIKAGLGSSKNNPISLVPRVRATSLTSVFDYCRFHRVCHSDEERKTFDENLLQMDARSLFDLIELASYLKLKTLIDCTCEEMIQRICNNSTEEICHMLNLPDDIPKVEKFELRGDSAYDSRSRLLEKLYNKKKQAFLKETENLKNYMAGIKAGEREDTRKVDDLVSFINGGYGDSQTLKKKKNRKKRAQKKTSSTTTASSSDSSALKKAIENYDEDPNAFDSANDGGSTADTLKLFRDRDESSKVKKDVDDSDWDPTKEEVILRDVVELARKFNLNYPDLI